MREGLPTEERCATPPALTEAGRTASRLPCRSKINQVSPSSSLTLKEKRCFHPSRRFPRRLSRTIACCRVSRLKQDFLQVGRAACHNCRFKPTLAAEKTFDRCVEQLPLHRLPGFLLRAPSEVPSPTICPPHSSFQEALCELHTIFSARLFLSRLAY